MHQKLARIQISHHQESLRKILIFSQIFFISVLIIQFICEFPSILKLTDITPVVKKGDRNFKENYRPVSILPNISQKSLNNACFVKSPVVWVPIYKNNNVGLEKVAAHSIACW